MSLDELNIFWKVKIRGHKLKLIFSFFLGLEPSNGFRCLIPQCDSKNATFESLKIPEDILFGKTDGEIDYCSPFKLVPNFPSDHVGPCTAEDFTTESYDFKVEDCDQILYADFEFKNTFVTENNLVCDKQFQVKKKLV